jgi:hypothetical protein
MRTRGLSTCLQSRRSGPRRCASSTLFAPTTANCSAARAAVSPFEPDPSDVLRPSTSRLQYGAVVSGTLTQLHLRVPRGYSASGGRRATPIRNTGCYPVGRLRLASACGNPVTAFDLCGDGSRNLATSARLRMRQMPAHALFERGAGRHDMPAMPTRVHGSGVHLGERRSIANRSVGRKPHRVAHGLIEAGQNPRRRVAFGDGAADHGAPDGM